MSSNPPIGGSTVLEVFPVVSVDVPAGSYEVNGSVNLAAAQSISAVGVTCEVDATGQADVFSAAQVNIGGSVTSDNVPLTAAVTVQTPAIIDFGCTVQPLADGLTVDAGGTITAVPVSGVN
jgi:hypothetical protein